MGRSLPWKRQLQCWLWLVIFGFLFVVGLASGEVMPVTDGFLPGVRRDEFAMVGWRSRQTRGDDGCCLLALLLISRGLVSLCAS